MTATNVTQMSEPTQDVAPPPTGAQFLASLLQRNGYPDIHAYGGAGQEYLSVPMIRPDNVGFLAIELSQPSPYILVCHEPIAWSAIRELGPDSFNAIADQYGIDDDRENETLVSPEMRFLNHSCLPWFRTFVTGLEVLIQSAAAIGRNRAYVDGAIYRVAEEIYEAEVSVTGSLSSGPFGSLSAELQDYYLKAAKAAVCGRMGGTNAVATGAALEIALRDVLPDPCEVFTADTARCVGRAALEALDEQRVAALEHRIARRLS